MSTSLAIGDMMQVIMENERLHTLVTAFRQESARLEAVNAKCHQSSNRDTCSEEKTT